MDYVENKERNKLSSSIIPLTSTISKKKGKIQSTSKDIFIVHGRDHKPVQELKMMLLEFGLDSIILNEQASGSLTIIEKLEKYSDVNYAFIILTPDDVGGTLEGFESALSGVMEERIDLEDIYGDFMYHRARQNVVLEFGYFIGKLGRERVCCLYKGDIELPSDMQGIVYIQFKDSINECHDKIIRELKLVGYKINTLDIKDRKELFDLSAYINHESLKNYLDKRFLPLIEKGLDSTIVDSDSLIEELNDMRILTLKELEEAIPKNFMDLIIPYLSSPYGVNYIGIIRDILIIHDIDAYFKKAFKNKWDNLSRYDLSFFKLYGIDIKKYSKLYKFDIV